MRPVDLGGVAGLADSRCFIYAGTDENWQTRLFSPGLLEWLARPRRANASTYHLTRAGEEALVAGDMRDRIHAAEG